MTVSVTVEMYCNKEKASLITATVQNITIGYSDTLSVYDKLQVTTWTLVTVEPVTRPVIYWIKILQLLELRTQQIQNRKPALWSQISKKIMLVYKHDFFFFFLISRNPWNSTISIGSSIWCTHVQYFITYITYLASLYLGTTIAIRIAISPCRKAIISST